MAAKLSFGMGNAKLAPHIYTFSIPSGHTCPGAHKCQARVGKNSGRMEDGPHMEHRCFAATQELRPSVRLSRWRNMAMLQLAKSTAGMRDLILASLHPGAQLVRVHIGGDFFSLAYFDAWMQVARAREHSRFYAYTKSLPFWVRRIGEIPDNFRLTASYGGKFDHLIPKHKLKSSQVVMHPEEAEALGLEIDHDDSHAFGSTEDFALLIHSMQPPGSKPSLAMRRMREEGIKFSYGHGANAVS